MPTLRTRLLLMTALAATPVHHARAATDITAVPPAPRAAPAFANDSRLPDGMIDSFQCNLWGALLHNRLTNEGPATIANEADAYLAECERNTPMS